MFTRPEAKKFLDTLLGEVFQNVQVERVKDFYCPEVIGHYREGRFTYDDIVERFKQLQNYSKQRSFVVEEFEIIDHLLVFRCRQTWVDSTNGELSESLVVGVYRIKESKVLELWLMTDEQMPLYPEVNANIVESMSQFNIHLKDKGKFLNYLSDYEERYKKSAVNLTPREIECLYYFLRGYSAKEVGLKLNISHRSVETYLATLKEKYGCSSKAELRKKVFFRDA